MATMLYLNPTGELVEVAQQQQSVMTLLQSVEPNMSPIDTSEGAQPRGGGMGMILPLMLIMVFVMLLARPRQDKEGEKFRNALRLEQDVVTSSGIFGKVKSIDEVSVVLEIAQNIRIKVDKRYVNPVPVPQPAKPVKEKKKKEKDPSKDEKA